MNKVLINRIQNLDICEVTDTQVYNVAEEFIVSYYNYIAKFIMLENKIDKNDIYICNNIYSSRTKGFLNWFQEEGKIYINDVLESLEDNRLDENAKSFSKLYSYLLNKSISNSNLDALIDYLYLIPKVMKREYEKFGFISNGLNIMKNIPLNGNNSKISSYILNIINFEGSENQVSCFI